MYVEIAIGVLLVSSFIYHRWVEDHSRAPPSEVGAPRTDEGAPVPLIYGRCRVRSPILAWTGQQRSVLVSDANPGFVYFVDMFYVAGIPFRGGGAVLKSIFAGDLQLFAESSTLLHTPGPSVIHVPYRGSPQVGLQSLVFRNIPAKVAIVVSGEDSVIFGALEFLGGSPTQVISDGINDSDPTAATDTQAAFEAQAMNDAYWFLPLPGDDATRQDAPLGVDQLPSLIPAYRNFCTVMMWRWCNGDRAALTNYSFEISSLTTLFGHSLADDADPAAVIYDLITAPFGKLGLPEAKIDTASFQLASDTLFAEEHGYSMSHEHIEDASVIIADILRQIDGILYEEPATGKIVLRLVRFDYAVGDLDDINPSNARPASTSFYQIQSPTETYNQVRVTFTSRANRYASDVAIGQNSAKVINQGGRLRPLDLQYPGISTREVAQRVASRELSAVSNPQVRVSVVVARAFYRSRPGDVVTFTWPELNIDHMVMRIVRVNLGRLHAGEIQLDMMRDIFDVQLGAFPVPDPVS